MTVRGGVGKLGKKKKYAHRALVFHLVQFFKRRCHVTEGEGRASRLGRQTSRKPGRRTRETLLT